MREDGKKKRERKGKENRVMEIEEHGVDAEGEINGGQDFHAGFFRCARTQ